MYWWQTTYKNYTRIAHHKHVEAKPSGQPLKWLVGLIFFLLAMGITFSEVGGM